MTQLAIWILCGFFISLGMSAGGMAHGSSLHFFDPFLTGADGIFDWSMLILFMAGLIPTFLYWQLFKRGPTPWFDSEWHIPDNDVIDRRLIAGSAIFGAGWALGGFCPGPSVAGMITGHPNFIAFSYGMYFYNVARPVRGGDGTAERHWGLTIGLGLVPAAFYFVGPVLFPLDQVSTVVSWPVFLSVLGGLGIALASILMYQFNGRVLGLCGLWRRILDIEVPASSRVPQLLFFGAFIVGGVVTYLLTPEALASPPYAERSLGWIFLGGLLTGHGTEWANGCTSGHGISGFARLSRRSLVAVPIFMAAVFVCLPLFNLALGG